MSKLGSQLGADDGIELNSTSAATRNAGVSTATGTLIYNSDSLVQALQVYKGNTDGWVFLGS